MSNRITEAEYAHYALTYAAAKMSAPLPPHSNHREAVLSALAVDDAKCILGVLPCMTNGEDGRKLVDDAFALPDKGGWVDYSIENPVTKRVEWKSSYIERISDDVVIGCGVYKSV